MTMRVHAPLSKRNADQTATGVFFIGLAILFMSGFWWPGLLFLLGAVNIARGMAEGRTWQSMQGGLWLIGIGLFFMIGFNWAILLILIGVSMLVGGFYRPQMSGCYDDDGDFHNWKRKRKNDDDEGDIFEV